MNVLSAYDMHTGLAQNTRGHQIPWKRTLRPINTGKWTPSCGKIAPYRMGKYLNYTLIEGYYLDYIRTTKWGTEIVK